LPPSSYIPGLVSSPMHEWIPEVIKNKLHGAFAKLRSRMPLFLASNAVMVGVESRTSSPVRIPRNPFTYEQMQVKRLFPAGEGAGYAGGITSSALDGINVAESVSAIIKKN